MPNQWLAFKWKTNTHHIINYNSLSQLITGTTIQTANNQYNKMLNSQSKITTRKIKITVEMPQHNNITDITTYNKTQQNNLKYPMLPTPLVYNNNKMTE